MGCEPLQVLIEDRDRPVDIEPGTRPTVRWRLDPLPSWADRVRLARVRVFEQPKGRVLVDTGIQPADELNGSRLPGPDMDPSRRYWLTVLLLDAQGRRLMGSEPITFGTGPGLVWHAQAIWSAEDERNSSGSQGNARGWALMRGVVRLPPGPILWASLYATADSTVPARQFVYRLWLNGRFLGCGPVFPLDGEDRYRGYEVTGLLRPGAENVLGVVAYAMEGRRFQAQLDVGRPDGSVEHYGTDAEWKAISGAEAFPDSASIGTTYYQAPAEDLDLSRYPWGFSRPGFDDSAWRKVRIRPSFSKCLAAPADGTRLTRVKAHRVLAAAPGYLLLDFGPVRLGGIGLRVDLSQHLDLTVRYGEVLDGQGGVRYRLATSNVYQDRWRLQPGSNRAQTWGIRVFRYLELIWPAESDPEGLLASLSDGGLWAECLEAPVYDDHARFHCDRPLLDEVWQLGRNTIRGLNADIYVDSWTRERAPYEADAWIQQRAHMVLDDAPALGRYSVDYLIANRTWPTEWPLYSILAVHDAWMHTGDLTQAAAQYERLMGLLPDKYLDQDSGLIVKDPGTSSQMDGDLVDWPPVERDGYVFGRVNTVINALASAAYKAMARLSRALGRRSRAGRLAEVSRKMQKALDERLYDPAVGAYRDGLLDGPEGPAIDHCAMHASAFVLAFAPPSDPARLEAVGAYLRRRGMACSAYAAAVLLDGLYRSGLGADALALLSAGDGIRTWKHMLDQGAGGTMEAWDPSIKSNTTYSHPWGASPVWLISSGLMGLRPLKPGYREFVVALQPGGLGRAELTMPVPTGDIHISYRITGKADSRPGFVPLPDIDLDLVVPQGCRGHLVLPPICGVRPGGQVEALLDGSPIMLKALDADNRVAGIRCRAGSLLADALPCGHHHLVLPHAQA